MTYWLDTNERRLINTFKDRGMQMVFIVMCLSKRGVRINGDETMDYDGKTGQVNVPSKWLKVEMEVS